ncbi:NitT/TauT family transport system permease protein [Erwinia toletana]|uniref:NitT/TauT family transport system permease protein n=1 Tax=Winslowiella toletana TaxID=92490 RepID=A0ABS4PFG1_9GAMM|nr:ABC transporter permease subunit [Winslowiella toletana]MBP2171381.1 NitT/TauT family transport system permease protein [Winslowiella toletana]
MSSDTFAPLNAATRRPSAALTPALLLAGVAWWALAALMIVWPDKPAGFAPPRFVSETHQLFILLAALLTVAALIGRLLSWRLLLDPLQQAARWLVALALLIGLWEMVTAKLALLPAPFFAPPRALVEAYATDWFRLGDSVLNSLRLLALGFLFGSLSGFVTGVAIGWSRGLGYWVHPLLRFLGPVPSTALLPLSLYFFPSSFSAAIFLIALATWFPVTVLTWSGVSSVDKRYYDVARTLGASNLFLILRVAVPASLPHVFVGLFMGLGASFSVLVAAEMMGVKSGLGWYLQWAQGWAAYANMYGALIVMAVLFSSLITLLFAVRDRLLKWQQNAVKW